MKADITNLCAELFDVPVEDLISAKRQRRISEARFALYAALRLRGWSYPRIGNFVGRHHTSILHGIRKADYLMDRYPVYAERVEKMSVWQPKTVDLSSLLSDTSGGGQ